MENLLAKTAMRTIGCGRIDPVSLTILAVVAGAYGIHQLVKHVEDNTKEEN